jgi:dienelactone hydrolase
MAIALLMLALLAIPFWPPVRTAIYTSALVPELMGLDVRPLAATTREPTRTTITYGAPADRMDVYTPAGAIAGSQLPAVVLELGIHPQPVDSPQIVQIGEAISRLGVVVGIPDPESLRNMQVPPSEPGHLADAVLAIRGLPEVDQDRVGLAGFSAGASMALIAAADPRIADDLQFVSAFGGYADADTLLVDVATSTTLMDGQVVPWEPDPGIRSDISTMLLSSGRLGPGDAEAVQRLFAATDRQAAEAAIADFGPDLKANLQGISPLAFADGVRTRVYLLHGAPDTAIPVAHAALLAEGLGDRVARFTEFGEFGHGQPGQAGLGPEDAGDIFGLYLYLRDIVAATLE